MKQILILISLTLCSFSQEPLSSNFLVKITSDISTISSSSHGTEVKIQRVQDVENVLIDDFTKTSRTCPPFCIQANKVDENIQNVAELEVLKFIKEVVDKEEGLLIDTRLKSWFELESLPTAINIPFSLLEKSSKETIALIFNVLGMKILANGSWDYSKVKRIVIFDNGLWCSQAKHFVSVLLKYDYPTQKIFYYRAGLQGWKLLGLTTVVHKELK